MSRVVPIPAAPQRHAHAAAAAEEKRVSPAPVGRGAALSSLLASRDGERALPRASGLRAVISTFADGGVEAEYASHQARRAVGARVALAACVCVGHGALAFAVRAEATGGGGGGAGYGAAAAGVGAFALAAGIQGLRAANTHVLGRASAAIAASLGLYLASQALPSGAFPLPLMLLVPSLAALAYAILLTPAAFLVTAVAVVAASLGAEATGAAFMARGVPSAAAVGAAAAAAALHAVVFALQLSRSSATECESFTATRQVRVMLLLVGVALLVFS
jgi:hypothetical protein